MDMTTQGLSPAEAYLRARKALSEVVNIPASRPKRMDVAWKVTALLEARRTGGRRIRSDPAIYKAAGLAQLARITPRIVFFMRKVKKTLVEHGEDPLAFEDWLGAYHRAVELEPDLRWPSSSERLKKPEKQAACV